MESMAFDIVQKRNGGDEFVPMQDIVLNVLDTIEASVIEILLCKDICYIRNRIPVHQHRTNYRLFCLHANLNDLKLKKANDERIAAENLAAAKELGKKIEGSEITIPIKVGEGGKTFGSVSSKEIAEEVKKQLGFSALSHLSSYLSPLMPASSLSVHFFHNRRLP